MIYDHSTRPTKKTAVLLQEDVDLFFDFVKSITVTGDSLILVPAIPHSSHVNVYSKDFLYLLRQLSVSCWPEFQIYNPVTGDLIVACSDRGTVQLQSLNKNNFEGLNKNNFDENSKGSSSSLSEMNCLKVRKLITALDSPESSSLWRPEGVALVPGTGHFIVHDSVSKRILLFDGEGIFLRILLKNVECVAFTCDMKGRIWLANRFDELRVFS